MAQETHVRGLPELNAFLQSVPIRVEKNILRGALRAGVNVIKPAAQQNLRQTSGAITLKVGTRARGGSVTANLKARSVRKGVPDNLPIWLEYGTRAHFISVQDSEKPINQRLSARAGQIVRASMSTVNRAIRSLKISGHFVGPTVYHPGARARPWIRPALDSQATNAVIAAAEYCKRVLATKHGIDTSHVMIEGDE